MTSEAQPGQEQRMDAAYVNVAAARLELIEVRDPPMQVRDALKRLTDALDALSGNTRPTADLGDDGELVKALDDVLDIIAAGQVAFSQTDKHVAYYNKRHEQVRQARDRLILYREALERIAEGDWHRTCEPPHEIDGSNRKVSGEWAKLASDVLVSPGLR